LREGFNRLSTNHRKTAFKLAKSVARLCGKYGVERVGFLTLTFAEHVTCAKLAGRRFSSLRTGVLAGRYVESICVLERMKSGRIHYHLLVVLAWDIRTGFNFEQAARRDYSSANEALRGEWAFWRRTAKLYRFGRTELMPVKSNEEGLSKYVGKYIAKHVGARETRDRGVHLVRYSRGASIGSNAFMFVSVRSRLWRYQVAEYARRNGCADIAELKAKFGVRWAYWKNAEIRDIEPPQARAEDTLRVGLGVVLSGRSAQWGDLWWTWLTDRAERAKEVAAGSGVEGVEAWAELYQPWVAKGLEFTVPRWSGVAAPQEEEKWEQTVVWNEGFL
jgi:hypothetical protein